MPARNETEEESRSQLLETGLFGDVTVGCGSKTWKLHKAILCSSSAFFKKALTGNWEEAKNGHVTIHETNPDHFDWIITLIYTKDLPDHFKSLASEAAKKVPAYGDLFAIADYLGVGLGMKLATDYLKAHLTQAARDIQVFYNFRNEDFAGRQYGSRESIRALFDTIAMAYNNPSPTFKPLRDAFVDFFRRTRFIVVRHEGYREGLFKVLFANPPKCLLCSRRATDYSDVWISKTARGLKGLCGDCNADAGKRDSYQELTNDARQFDSDSD